MLEAMRTLLLILLAHGATSPAPQDGSPQPEREVLGGCILLEPVGVVPADVYFVGDVVATSQHAPFTKQLVACGLTLVARDDVPDAFLK